MSVVEGSNGYPYPASADTKLGDVTTDLMNTSRDPVARVSQSIPRFFISVSRQSASYLAIHLANDESSACQVPELS